ncbi:MAG: zinc ABC transporter substrate-binding protein [Fervidicoccaceae archaeon]
MHIKMIRRPFRVVLVALLLVALSKCTAEAEEKLTVVVTMDPLVGDLLELVDDRARVVSVASGAPDPHEYALKPSDVELLRRADVIITTLHAPFELRIQELVERGELRPRAYVVVHEVPGIKLLRNPATSQLNLHGVLYLPENLKSFVTFVASLLSELDPEGRDLYLEKARDMLIRIEELETRAAEAPRLRGVISSPLVQYAAVFLNVEPSLVLTIEPDVPPSPDIAEEALEALRTKRVDVVVVCGRIFGGTVEYCDQADEILARSALKWGVPPIVVPPPMTGPGFLEHLELALESYESARDLLGLTGGERREKEIFLASAVAAAIAISMALIYSEGRELEPD